SADGKESTSVAYRPLKYDVLQYLPRAGELRVNARSKWEKTLYREQLGKHVFGRADFFQPAQRYTLDPLYECGEAALGCVDVIGVEHVTLIELELYWGGRYGETEIWKADDLFAAMKERHRSIPEAVPLLRAVFRVKFKED